MSKKINISLLGAKYTGKSSIINMLINSYFEESYTPTIENKLNKLYSYKNKLYTLGCYDTGGVEDYHCLVPDTIKNCECFIIVYSLIDRESIDKIQIYIDLIKDNFKYCRGDLPPIILVANKSDYNDNEILISKNEQTELSKVYQSPTINCSCKDLNSINSIFNLLIDTIELKEKQTIKNYSNFNKIPKIIDFKINKESIIIKSLYTSSYYKNWTLYDDIEFKIPKLVINFDCKILDGYGNESNRYRECKFETRLNSIYKNKLIANSIDSCIEYPIYLETETEIDKNKIISYKSECGILLIDKVHPFPIILNEINTISTNGETIKIIGNYLNFDINYLLWNNKTDKIQIIKKQQQPPPQNSNNNNNTDSENEVIYLNIPSGYSNNEFSIIINWNFNNPIPIIYKSPKINNITITTSNSNNINEIEYINIDGENFYNDSNLIEFKNGNNNNIGSSNNIIYINHNKIIYNNNINNLKNNSLNLNLPIIIKVSNLESNIYKFNNTIYGKFEIIEIDKINSDFSTINGKLIIKCKNIPNDSSNKIKVTVGGDEINNKDIKILNSTIIQINLPNGKSDGTIIPITINGNKFEFQYNKPEIKLIYGLSREGGVVSIFGINFCEPFKIEIGNELCTSPKLINHNQNKSKNINQIESYPLDLISCYIGPIHNESIEFAIIKLIVNEKLKIEFLKNYPKSTLLLIQTSQPQQEEQQQPQQQPQKHTINIHHTDKLVYDHDIVILDNNDEEVIINAVKSSPQEQSTLPLPFLTYSITILFIILIIFITVVKRNSISLPKIIKNK